MLRHRERNVCCTLKIAIWFKSGWSLSRSFKWVFEREIFFRQCEIIWPSGKTRRWQLDSVSRLLTFKMIAAATFIFPSQYVYSRHLYLRLHPFFDSPSQNNHRLVCSCLCSPVNLFLCGKTAGQEDETDLLETEKITLKFIFFPRDIKTLSIQRESFSSKRQHGSIY